MQAAAINSPSWQDGWVIDCINQDSRIKDEMPS